MLSNRMKSITIALLAVLLSPVLAHADGIQWVSDPREAAKMAAQRQVPILIHATASWCTYCHKMAQNTYTKADVIQFAGQNFVCLKLDADKEKEIVKALNISSLPTTVIITPEMQVVSSKAGYSDAKTLMKQLTASSQKYLAWNNRLPAQTQQSVAKLKQVRQTGQRLAASTPRPTVPAGVTTTTPQVATTTAPVTSPVQPAVVTPPPAMPQAPVNQVVATTAPQATPPNNPWNVGPNGVPQTRPNTQARYATTTGNAPVRQVSRTQVAFGFNQLCLVTLFDKRQKQPGNPAITSVYRGQTVCFASPQHKAQFDQNPDRYWPMLDGKCAVSRVGEFQERPGKPDYGAVFRGRMWFFTSSDYMRQFIQNPKNYLRATQGPGT